MVRQRLPHEADQGVEPVLLLEKVRHHVRDIGDMVAVVALEDRQDVDDPGDRD